MAWTHRERVLAALNHEEADRVPIDFGSAGPTAIVGEAYQNLTRHLNLEHKAETLQQLKTQVYPDEAVLRRFDVDTRGIQSGKYANGHSRVIDAHTIMDEFGVTWRQTQGTQDIHFLHVGTADEVRAETGRIIDIFGRSGGYVLNAVHAIQAEVPPANIVAMYDTGIAHAY